MWFHEIINQDIQKHYDKSYKYAGISMGYKCDITLQWKQVVFVRNRAVQYIESSHKPRQSSNDKGLGFETVLETTDYDELKLCCLITSLLKIDFYINQYNRSNS